MRAVTVSPGKRGSQRLDEVPEPPDKQGSILVRSLAVGICGTDRELVEGLYGEAAPGRERLVLGHESLGRVISAPPHSGFIALEPEKRASTSSISTRTSTPRCAAAPSACTNSAPMPSASKM